VTRARIVITMALAAVLAFAPAALAQEQFDRTKIPAPGKPPELRVPSWTKDRLANGADLIVSERHDLPLVSFTITFLGGSNQYEPSDKRGTASFTAALLSEGTKTRDAEAISLALQLLGTSIGTSVGDESGSMSFVSTTASFQPTLDILADLLVNPTFPEKGLERLRAQRLVALTQANALPGAVNSRVFSRVLFGAEHPYGQRADETSLEAITRDDIGAFHRAYFQPGRAIVTVVGDVEPKALKATLDKAFANWPAGGERPAFKYPPAPQPQKRTIYLVDMPGSAQSVFNMGHPGPARDTPDFFALQVMNTMLGGMFQSRLNANIREEKGYSYGVRSGFGFGKGPGPFSAGGDIVSDKSDAALQEFMRELRGIQGERPITDEEMDTAKNSLIQRLPGQFGAVAQINNAITTLYVQGLPENYYQAYGKNIAAITRDDVLRVAKQYIDLERMAIVIVGDRKTIEEPLAKTGVAPIVHLDKEGKPIER
jgi:zinc protease